MSFLIRILAVLEVMSKDQDMVPKRVAVNLHKIIINPGIKRHLLQITTKARSL